MSDVKDCQCPQGACACEKSGAAAASVTNIKDLQAARAQLPDFSGEGLDIEDLSTDELMDMVIADMPAYARALKAAMIALEEAGFSAPQAFELVRARGWDLGNTEYLGG